MGLTDDIREIEAGAIQCNRRSEDYYGYVKGSIPILISAPHGAKHYRTSEKRWKAEDAFTSSWAIKLGRMTGAHVLYLKNKTTEDPNNDLHSRYKDFLAKIVKESGIRFVIDLHGADRNEPFKIDVGILDDRTDRSSCPTFKAIIEGSFRDFDKGVFNKRFSASRPCTITSFTRNTLGIEAAQFEINARYRVIPKGTNPQSECCEADVLDLMGRLQRMIIAVNRKIADDPSGRPQTISMVPGANPAKP